MRLDSINEFVELYRVRPQGPPVASAHLPPEQASLFERLTGEPVTLDELVSGTGLDVGNTLGMLSRMEIGGWVEQCAGARYRRALPVAEPNAGPDRVAVADRVANAAPAAAPGAVSADAARLARARPTPFGEAG